MLASLISRLWRRTRAHGVPALLAEGASLVQQGRAAEGRIRLEQVVSLDPANARGLYWLGVVHGMEGSRAAAADYLTRAIAAQPDLAAAHADLGNVRLLDGDVDAAIRCYRSALALDPKFSPAYRSLARTLRRVGRHGQALECLVEAYSHSPLEDDALLDLVQLMLELGQRDEARKVAESEAAARPTQALVVKAAGIAALACHDPHAALERFATARAIAPPDADLWLNTGIALQELLRLEEALAAYATALEINPDFAPARWRMALVRLMLGDFEAGWPDYEARHGSADRRQREFPYPRWSGEPLQGQTIVVHAEQGLGDEIMFASCLPDVIDAAKLCIIDCHPKLAAIFRRSFPAALVHAGEQIPGPQPWLEAFPAPSFQIPAGSLPGLLRRSRRDFPRHRGYLAADPQRIEFWRRRLAALGMGLKIGLSWKGGTRVSRSALRSIALEELMPLLQTPGVRFVNLQYTPVDEELTALEQRHAVRVENWPEAIADYDETAALIMALDLVISVCTAVVHLSGALGRPVWVMAPYSPEWRYGCAGSDMPWYPSARIYRQPGFKQWQPVIGQIASDLRRYA